MVKMRKNGSVEISRLDIDNLIKREGVKISSYKTTWKGKPYDMPVYEIGIKKKKR